MARRSSRANGVDPGRAQRESTEGLTFLEKLVSRALPTRQVPPESGVRFAIGSIAKNDGVCLVFRSDDAEAPIFEAGPRADYVVVHLSDHGR